MLLHSSTLSIALNDLFYLQVIDHYENPRNVGSLDKNDKDVGTGLVGAPACGDVMKLQVRRFTHGANFSIHKRNTKFVVENLHLEVRF